MEYQITVYTLNTGIVWFALTFAAWCITAGEDHAGLDAMRPTPRIVAHVLFGPFALMALAVESLGDALRRYPGGTWAFVMIIVALCVMRLSLSI